jgi:hypothetical protein
LNLSIRDEMLLDTQTKRVFNLLDRN